VNDKPKLTKLLQEVDKLILEDIELKGYILFTVNTINEITLIYQGKNKQDLLAGLDALEEHLNDMDKDDDDQEC
jgi:hypothetical protein